MRCPVCEANKDGKCMAGVIPYKSKKSVDGIGCNLNRRTVKKRMRGENMGGIYIPNMTEEMAKEHLRGFIYIPVPPHGRWNNIIQGIIPSGQCSNCGAWDKVTRFCPNCGSRMEDE